MCAGQAGQPRKFEISSLSGKKSLQLLRLSKCPRKKCKTLSQKAPSVSPGFSALATRHPAHLQDGPGARPWARSMRTAGAMVMCRPVVGSEHGLGRGGTCQTGQTGHKTKAQACPVPLRCRDRASCRSGSGSGVRGRGPCIGFEAKVADQLGHPARDARGFL